MKTKCKMNFLVRIKEQEVWFNNAFLIRCPLCGKRDRISEPYWGEYEGLWCCRVCIRKHAPEILEKNKKENEHLWPYVYRMYDECLYWSPLKYIRSDEMELFDFGNN